MRGMCFLVDGGGGVTEMGESPLVSSTDWTQVRCRQSQQKDLLCLDPCMGPRQQIFNIDFNINQAPSTFQEPREA